MSEKQYVVYISGPMTGIKDFNYPAFREAEKRLRKMGYDVINPAETGEYDTNHLREPTWTDYMVSAIKRMRYATAIHYLPDWEKSFGARIEAIVAERGKMKIIEESK